MGKSPADQFCSGSLASTQTGRSPNVFVSENVAAINDSITLSGFLLLIRKVLVEQKKTAFNQTVSIRLRQQLKG